MYATSTPNPTYVFLSLCRILVYLYILKSLVDFTGIFVVWLRKHQKISENLFELISIVTPVITTKRDKVFGWVTPVFELYCIAEPNTNRNALAQSASKIAQWVQREEERSD
jgi:hypothetical protein